MYDMAQIFSSSSGKQHYIIQHNMQVIEHILFQLKLSDILIIIQNTDEL
jgi:hypothetical protein